MGGSFSKKPKDVFITGDSQSGKGSIYYRLITEEKFRLERNEKMPPYLMTQLKFTIVSVSRGRKTLPLWRYYFNSVIDALIFVIDSTDRGRIYVDNNNDSKDSKDSNNKNDNKNDGGCGCCTCNCCCCCCCCCCNSDGVEEDLLTIWENIFFIILLFTYLLILFYFILFYFILFIYLLIYLLIY